MQPQIGAYHNILKQLINLQQQLIRIFEADVEIIPPSPQFIERFKLAHLDWASSSISQIVQIWPNHGIPFALELFIKQRKGILAHTGQHWLFTAHGADEVLFMHLSSNLDNMILAQFKQGNTDALIGSHDSYYGNGGAVEAKYLCEGRTDGVSAWSAFVFARSIECPFHQLSQSEHQQFLEAFVNNGILVPWPDLNGQHGHFVFAPTS